MPVKRRSGMKIRALMENTARAPEIFSEHGLSLYIETGKHQIGRAHV